MENKFNLYQVVTIQTKRCSLLEINKCKGHISGMSKNHETGKWGYAVCVYADNCYVWSVMEDELIPTGEVINKEKFMTRDTVKVRVDPKTGEGEIVDDD